MARNRRPFSVKPCSASDVDQHHSAYDPRVTELCEQALVTVIGNAGFWGRHLYLVGGLAPRYLTREAVHGPAHVGSRDVDFAIDLAVDESAAEYETLVRNLTDGGFAQPPFAEGSQFRWTREVDGQSVIVEFLGESPDVEPGQSFKPRGHSGRGFLALNVPGVRLVALDFEEVEIAADRLDAGGHSKASVRVTRLLPFVVLKSFAYRSRHNRKDAYDLVYVLQNQMGGPVGAGRLMAESPVASDPLVAEALAELAERFGDPANDAPTDYGAFMAVGDDPDSSARYRNESVAVVEAALSAFNAARVEPQ